LRFGDVSCENLTAYNTTNGLSDTSGLDADRDYLRLSTGVRL